MPGIYTNIACFAVDIVLITSEQMMNFVYHMTRHETTILLLLHMYSLQHGNAVLLIALRGSHVPQCVMCAS